MINKLNGTTFASCNISINIQHGGTRLFSNSTNSCITIILHTSTFSGSSKISRYLYYSTDNCMLTWGKIGVACYFWMALYMIINLSSNIKNTRVLKQINKCCQKCYLIKGLRVLWHTPVDFITYVDKKIIVSIFVQEWA